MTSSYSYTSTVNNNITENEAFTYLLENDNNFKIINRSQRKIILNLFNLDSSFSRAFDLVYIKGNKKNITELSCQDILLVELKTTKKKLINNPAGFFFGATENEFKLARLLKEKYKFCFVCLSPDLMSYKMLSLTELEKKIKTKRVQYQINLNN